MGYSIGLIIVMMVLFYFMLIRPENKKKKAAEELRNSLKIGDDVTTIGGILGTVCAVKENSVVIETGADRVRIDRADRNRAVQRRNRLCAGRSRRQRAENHRQRLD